MDESAKKICDPVDSEFSRVRLSTKGSHYSDLLLKEMLYSVNTSRRNADVNFSGGISMPLDAFREIFRIGDMKLCDAIFDMDWSNLGY